MGSRMERLRDRRILAIALLVVGLVAVAIGVIYFQVSADRLPAFMGKIANHPIHRTKRGLAAVIAGAILIVAGLYSINRSRRSRFHRSMRP